MIIDGNLQFASSQAVTATGTTTSTNIINFGSVADLGITERPLEVFVDWTTAPVGSTPGTTNISYSLQVSSTGTSGWVTLLTSEAYTDTATPVGAFDIFDIPPGAAQYAQLVYNVASGSLTAGAVSAGIVLDVGATKYYPRGYTA